MNIFIITEGGADIGFGHLSRCAALAAAAKKIKHGLNIKLIVKGDKSAEKFLEKQDVKFIMLDWAKKRNGLLSLLGSARAVIIDSYLAGASFYSDMKARGFYTAAIDDYNRLHYDADMVINPSLYGKGFMGGEIKPHTEYLLGRDYIILRKEFWKGHRKNIRTKIKKILITLGGIKHPLFMKRLMERLLKRFPEISYYILTGEDNSLKGNSLCRRKNINIYPTLNAFYMRKLIYKSDVCISSGGQTLYELARCGTPAIGICFAENQALNLKAMENAGLARNAGYYRQKNILANVCAGLEKMTARKRFTASNKGRKTIDGKGALRIMAKILTKSSLGVKTRKAAKRDCYDIWKWRNNPEVRARSFNSKKIPYKHHKQWFHSMLKNKSAALYIGENRAGAAIGQARFNLDGERKAFVSVNLNPKFFGKGLGNELIKSATSKFINEFPETNAVFAEMFNDNMASKKAFMKAGYAFYRKKDSKINIFKLQKDRYGA